VTRRDVSVPKHVVRKRRSDLSHGDKNDGGGVHDDACRSLPVSRARETEFLMDSEDTRSARAHDRSLSLSSCVLSVLTRSSARRVSVSGRRRQRPNGIWLWKNLSRGSFRTTPREDGRSPRVAGASSRATGRASNVRSYANRKERKQFLVMKTTLSQAWSGNCIRGPQCAFEMSMFMCPAVHKLTRN